MLQNIIEPKPGLAPADTTLGPVHLSVTDGDRALVVWRDLVGLTLLSHQIGGFLGAWLGGLAITRFGDYGWMWWADIVLALLAALVNLPIREARMPRNLAPA